MLSRSFLLVILLTIASRLVNAMEHKSNDRPALENLSSIITNFALELNIDTPQKQRAFILTMNTFNDLAIEASHLALNLALDKIILNENLPKDNWQIVFAAMEDFANYFTAAKTAAGYDLEIFGNDVPKPPIENIVNRASETVLDPNDIRATFQNIAVAVLEQLSVLAPTLLPSINTKAQALLSDLNSELSEAFLGPWDSLEEIALMDWPLDINIFLTYFINAPEFITSDKKTSSILLRAGSSNNCTMALLPGSLHPELPMAFLGPWQLLQRIILLNWAQHVRIFLAPWSKAIGAVKSI